MKTATKQPSTENRLEYLRGEIRAERISWDELHELQCLAETGQIDASDTELLEAAGVDEATTWQLTMRQRLGLTPDRTDVISRLLFAAIEAAEDEDDFLNLVTNHRDELQRNIEIVRGVERERMVANLQKKAGAK